MGRRAASRATVTTTTNGVTEKSDDPQCKPQTVDLGDMAGLKRGLDDCALNVSFKFVIQIPITKLRAAIRAIRFPWKCAREAPVVMQAVLDAGYQENYLTSNVKIGIGSITWVPMPTPPGDSI